ncbi:MAG: sensor domain-containing diguanylate cyclase [Nitrospirota bacterium]
MLHTLIHRLLMTVDNISYKNVIDNMCDGVYFVDLDRRIIYWNRAAEDLTGFKNSEVVGRHCRDNILVHVDDKGLNLCMNGCPLQKTIIEGSQCEVEVYLHHKSGHRVPVLVRSTPLKDREGAIIGAVEIFSDNSASIAYRLRVEDLEKEAFLDHLTRLVNRRYAEINLDSKLGEMTRYNLSFGILFMDIDRFKEVNDTYGHETGDSVLQMVANTILKTSRSFDTISRWGGDEFVGIISYVDKQRLFQIADRFRILVEQSAIYKDSGVIKVTISIGAAMARPGDTADILLKRADSALYECKASGRNRVLVE